MPEREFQQVVSTCKAEKQLLCVRELSEISCERGIHSLWEKEMKHLDPIYWLDVPTRAWIPKVPAFCADVQCSCKGKDHLSFAILKFGGTTLYWVILQTLCNRKHSVANTSWRLTSISTLPWTVILIILFPQWEVLHGCFELWLSMLP